MGRVPLSLCVIKPTLHYWVKLENANEGLLLHHCLKSEKELNNNGIYSWFSMVRKFTMHSVSNDVKIDKQLVKYI